MSSPVAAVSSARSRVLAYGSAPILALVSLWLLPALIVSPPAKPDLQWWSAELYFARIPAFVWPFAFVALFLLTAVPFFLPRRLRSQDLIWAAARTALLVALILSVVFLVALAIEPLV
jgi:hypothetical protein